MFALLLIKFNQYPLRTRLIAGLSVVFAALIIFAYGYYRLAYYDELARFTSVNTELYLHLDDRAMPDNLFRLKVIDAVLRSFDVSDLDRKLIGSELAIICDRQAGIISCGLTIETRRAPEFKNYLAGKQLSFQELDSKTYIIGDNDAWLKTIKRSYNPFRYRKYQGRIGSYGALTAVFNRPALANSDLSKILQLSGLNNSLKLSGALTGQEIGFRFSAFAGLPGFSDNKKVTEAANSPDCDIQINSSHGISSNILQNYIIGLFSGLSEGDISNFSDQSFSLCLNQTNSAGNLLDNYDFVAQSSNALDARQITDLEKILLNLAARLRPTEKNYYLSDGTRISELWSRPEKASFETSNSLKFIRLDGANRSLYYSNSLAGWKIGNKIGLNYPNETNDSADFIKIRLDSLPQSEFKELLSDFSYLIITKDRAIIR